MPRWYFIETDYRKWLKRGSGDKPGYTHFFSVRLFWSLLIGAALSFAVHKSLDVVGTTVLLPTAAVFVGVVFAWCGAAQSLLQSDEILTISTYHKGGLSDFVFGFQTTIQLIMVTLAGWGLASLGLFNGLPTHHHPLAYRIVCVALYTLTVASVGDCWGLISSSQLMVLSRAVLQLGERKKREDDGVVDDSKRGERRVVDEREPKGRVREEEEADRVDTSACGVR